MGILARLFLLLAIALVPTATIQIYDELDRRQAQEAELHAEALAQLRPALLQNRDLCAATLGRLATQQQRYAYIALADIDGNILCASTPRPPRDELTAQQAFIRAAAIGGDFSVGNAAVTADGKRFLPLALPVAAEGGKVTEIVLAALSLDWLAASLPASLLPPGAILELADRAGTVIAELPQAEGAPYQVGDTLPEARRVLMARTVAGTLEGTDPGGGARVFGYKPLDAPPAPGVYVEVGLDRDAALATMDRATARHGMAAIAALLAGWATAAPNSAASATPSTRWRKPSPSASGSSSRRRRTPRPPTGRNRASSPI